MVQHINTSSRIPGVGTYMVDTSKYAILLELAPPKVEEGTLVIKRISHDDHAISIFCPNGAKIDNNDIYNILGAGAREVVLHYKHGIWSLTA